MGQGSGVRIRTDILTTKFVAKGLGDESLFSFPDSKVRPSS